MIVLIFVASHVIVAGICDDYLFCCSFCVPLAFAGTAAGRGSLAGGVTQDFIPEWSGSLVVMPKSGCCTFSIEPNCRALGLTKRRLEESPVYSRYTLPPSLWNDSLQAVPLVVRSMNLTSLPCLWIQRQEEPKMAGWQS